MYACFMLIGTFISSIAQVILKKAAISDESVGLRAYLNYKVIFAYMIFFGATFLGVLSYKDVPLSMGAILEATGYIYVTIFGAVLFGEQITRKKIIALLAIIGGTIVYAL